MHFSSEHSVILLDARRFESPDNALSMGTSSVHHPLNAVFLVTDFMPIHSESSCGNGNAHKWNITESARLRFKATSLSFFSAFTLLLASISRSLEHAKNQLAGSSRRSCSSNYFPFFRLLHFSIQLTGNFRRIF